ncbi:MAG: hypothetical protein KF716_05750 [Anaerolineae bacterium]|nr:hypothetical protein [Anaerolineae bacterium]
MDKTTTDYVVVGYFDDVKNAWQAFQALRDAGYTADQISFVANEESLKAAGINSDPTKNGVTAGSLIGGTAGAALGLIALAIPGVGPVLAIGPLFGVFAGGVAGSIAGGFIGARVNWQNADDDLHVYYEEGLRRGGALLLVNAPPTEGPKIQAIFQQYNRTDIRQRAQQWQSEGWTPTPAENMTERRGAEGAASQSGKVAGIASFPSLNEAYQRHFNQTLGTTGRSYADYSLGYLYGYNLANDERYRDQNWNAIEEEIHEDWEQKQKGTWAEYGPIIQFARDKALNRV